MNWRTFVLRMAVQMELTRKAARLYQEMFPHLRTSAAIGRRLECLHLLLSVGEAERALRTRDVEQNPDVSTRNTATQKLRRLPSG
jgi:hypothetical protein